MQQAPGKELLLWGSSSLKYLRNHFRKLTGPSRLVLILLGYVTVLYLNLLLYSEVIVKGMNCYFKQNIVTYCGCTSITCSLFCPFTFLSRQVSNLKLCTGNQGVLSSLASLVMHWSPLWQSSLTQSTINLATEWATPHESVSSEHQPLELNQAKAKRQGLGNESAEETGSAEEPKI